MNCTVNPKPGRPGAAPARRSASDSRTAAVASVRIRRRASVGWSRPARHIRTATAKLGRAAQLAEQTGNAEATSKLRRVVDIEEPATGKVRLKKQVDKLDEMALDTASTKTTRVRK